MYSFEMLAPAISTPAIHFTSSRYKAPSSVSVFSHRNSARSVVSALPSSPYGDPSTSRLSLRIDEKGFGDINQSYGAVAAKTENPQIMPPVMTPGGTFDLPSVLFRNRIIFIGQPITSQVAERVISQLVTLAAIDEKADIQLYLNCPGGSTYSVLAIYDCMSWIKPKVRTICVGVAASQGAIILAGGEKGMRYAMPNARIMIHQPPTGCGGHVEDVKRQIKEALQNRNKIDRMYAAFTGQPLEKVQQYTNRDTYFAPAEAMEFGLIDGILETLY